MSDIITSSPVSSSGSTTAEVKTVEYSTPEVKSFGSDFTAPAPAVEAPAAPVVEEPKVQNPEEQRMTSRFQELKRREKEAHRQAAELKQQSEGVRRLAELKASPNLLERLAAVDLNFEDLVEYVVSGDSQPKEPTVEDKIVSLENKLKAKEDSELKAQQQQIEVEYNKVENTFRNRVMEIAGSDQAYEHIFTTDSHDLVIDLVQEVAKTHNQTLPILEAMKLVEAQLRQEAEQKTLKANTYRSRFQPPQADQQASHQAKPQVPLTLSSAQNTQAIIRPAGHTLTRDEAREQALTLLRFK